MVKRFERLKNKILGLGIDQSDRTLKILKEILDNVVKDMSDSSVWSEGLKDLEYSVDTRTEGRNNVIYTITITDPVFNILDEGVNKVPRYASEYGLKAFPLHYARSPKESKNNQHMTIPNSLVFRQAKVVEDVLFRPVIYTPIAARNFMYQIEDRLRDRIREEGLQVEVTVKKEKGDV